MQYLTQERYSELGGTVTGSAFMRYEIKCEILVDYWTSNRIKVLEEVPKEVELLMVEMVDAFAEEGEGKNVSSFSNDGVSVTFDEKPLEERLYDLAVQYLPADLVSVSVDSMEASYYKEDVLAVIRSLIKESREQIAEVKRMLDAGEFDGISPDAKVEQLEDGAKLTITDRNGTTEAKLTNGTDGYTPRIEAVQTETGADVTITNQDGKKTVQLKNGTDGTDGKDGTTPVKGVDYYTPQEAEDFRQDLRKYADAEYAPAIKPTRSGNPLLLEDSTNRDAVSVSIGGTTAQNPIRHITAPVITADKVTGGQKMPTRLVSDAITDFTGKKIEVMGKNLINKTILKMFTQDIDPKTTYENGTLTYEISKSGGSYSGEAKVFFPKGEFSVSSAEAYEEQKRTNAIIQLQLLNRNENKNVYLFFYGDRQTKIIDFDVTSIRFNCYKNDMITEKATFKMSDLQLEYGKPTTYEPPIPPASYTANSDGTVDGVMSVEGNMTMLTDSGADIDVVIPEIAENGECEEIRDTGKNLFKFDHMYEENVSTVQFGKGSECYLPKGKYVFSALNPYDELNEFQGMYVIGENGKSITSKFNTTQLEFELTDAKKVSFMLYDSPTKYFNTDIPKMKIMVRSQQSTAEYEPFKGFIEKLSQRYELSKWDRIYKDAEGWKYSVETAHIPSYNGETITGEYVSSTGMLTTGADVYYRIPPVITPLPQADADILDKIETFYPNTTISADGNVVLNIQYVADILNFIKHENKVLDEKIQTYDAMRAKDTDEKVGEVRKAVVSLGEI